MPATLLPPIFTPIYSGTDPIVEVEALRPGRISRKFHASEAGDRFYFAEAEAVELEVRGMVRIAGDLTPVGRDYRAAFREHGLACGGYSAYVGGRLRGGPTDPEGDVGPPLRARVIGGGGLVVAGVYHPPGEFVSRTWDQVIRETYKPGAPWEAPEGLLAVPFFYGMVELLGEPTPRFRRFVAAYAAYRQRCDRTANHGPCPEY